MNTVKNPFNTYRTYALASQDRATFKDYARMDCRNGTKNVGQIPFGTSISPGTNGSIINNNGIHLYFPSPTSRTSWKYSA